MDKITDLNKSLCEQFGICWHEKIAGPYMCKHCGDASPKLRTKPKVESLNPDLLALVDIPCGECGGSGRIVQTRSGKSAINHLGEIPCPTCNGYGIRRITRLQQIMEEREPTTAWDKERYKSEWEAFTESNHKYHFRKLTDTIQLGRAVLAWKGE